VFEKDRELVGYALIIPCWSNERQKDVLWIDEFYVVPEWRNRGTGSAFFEHLGTSEAGRAYSLEIETYPWNQRALALYRNLGFTGKGRVLLEKTL
jgi:GNAT superfamily N-acetyltransferase